MNSGLGNTTMIVSPLVEAAPQPHRCILNSPHAPHPSPPHRLRHFKYNNGQNMQVTAKQLPTGRWYPGAATLPDGKRKNLQPLACRPLAALLACACVHCSYCSST